MARLLFIKDYTEQFAYRLLRGIISYSSLSGKWVVYRMTLSEKRKLGIDGVLKWALDWKADVVVGQFEEGEDVGKFRENGIVAKVLNYINNNIDRKISEPDILREVPMSRRLLENRFKALKGCTPSEYKDKNMRKLAD